MNKNDYIDQKIDQMIDEALNKKRDGQEKECHNPFICAQSSDQRSQEKDMLSEKANHTESDC